MGTTPSDGWRILRRVATTQTEEPFVEAVPRLLKEHGLSLRALAREAGVSHSFLSRVLRERDYKRAGPELARRTAIALDLPADYFAEYREGVVIDEIRRNPRLRNDLYRRLRRK